MNEIIIQPPLGKREEEAIIAIRNLGKRYRLGADKNTGMAVRDMFKELLGRREADAGRDFIWALKNLTFDVKKGERIGIIGRNGAGKSTLLKVMSRIIPPTTGEVRLKGRLTSLLEVGTGFNDNLTGRENVFLNASLYGLTREEVHAKYDDIVAFSEVARFIDTPVKNYSSGMKMRLAFAVAAHLDPDILLMDEVLAVGDMAFQRKCLEKVEGMTSGGRTLFFVSHSMDAVMRYCDRCIWLDGGIVREDGPSEDVVSAYVEEVLGARSHVGGTAQPEDDDATATVESGSDPEPEAEEPEKEASKIDAPAKTADEKPDPQKGLNAVLTTPTIVAEDATAFLIEGSVCNAKGEKKTLFRVDQPVRIKLSYRTTAPALYVPAIHLYCPQGTIAFVSCPPVADPAAFRIEKSGKHEAVVEIPPHLLNIGTYRASILVFSPDEAPFKRHFTADMALAFTIVDVDPGGHSARGIMPRPFPGPVRPLLDWKVTEL